MNVKRNVAQEKFPLEVTKRQSGEDDVDPDEIFPCVPNHQFASEVRFHLANNKFLRQGLPSLP